MLHIAGGIFLALAILLVLPIIFEIAIFGVVVIVILAVAASVLVILDVYVGLSIAILLGFIIFCFWVILGIMRDNSQSISAKPRQRAVKNSVLSQISEIGGPKNWVEDFVRRHTPTFTLHQKFRKTEYIEIKRPQILISAANARRIKESRFGEERKLRLISEENRLKFISEREKIIFDAQKDKKIQKIKDKFFNEIEILKRKFFAQNNIVFSSSDARSHVEIYGKDGILIAYELFVEIRISRIPKSSLSEMPTLLRLFYGQWDTFVSYQISRAQNGQKLITKEKSLSDFRRTIVKMIISDAVKSRAPMSI